MESPVEPRQVQEPTGLLLPALAGLAVSGLPLAAVRAPFDDAFLLWILLLVGGAALMGLIVGNPGNEVALLVGTLLPGGVTAALELRRGCVDAVLPAFLLVVTALVPMTIGLILGIIVGSDMRIGPVRRPLVFGILAPVALLSVAAWIVTAARAAGQTC